MHQLESSSFLISFKVLLEVLASLRSLTLNLQMQTIDVLYAYKEVNRVIKVLKKARENSERVLQHIHECIPVR